MYTYLFRNYVECRYSNITPFIMKPFFRLYLRNVTAEYLRAQCIIKRRAMTLGIHVMGRNDNTQVTLTPPTFKIRYFDSAKYIVFQQPVEWNFQLKNFSHYLQQQTIQITTSIERSHNLHASRKLRSCNRKQDELYSPTQ